MTNGAAASDTPTSSGRAVGGVRLPVRHHQALSAVIARVAIATALLLATTLIVYLGRHGYIDAARPGRPLRLVDALYYSTVSLSATGFGDIVPVTTAARLVNTFVLTPIRVAFLIVVVSTTIEVFAEQTRRGWRIFWWRSKLTGHTVLVGYGTKGRSTLATLRGAGIAGSSVVIVDSSPDVIAEANEAGLTGVTGDATRAAVLDAAGTREAACLVVAVGRDDSAVLITLTGRQLNPAMTIVAEVKESENESLLQQSGADQVVVSADTAGRMLALSTIEPAASAVLSRLAGRNLGLIEWPAGPAEIGRPAVDSRAGTIAVVRGSSVLALDDPRAGQIEPGDRLVRVSAGGTGRTGQ